jgi:aerobic carbon-monoxide dehydrogenase medium subunit
MKAAPLQYVRAQSLADALARRGNGGARFLAGGQSLVPALAFRLSEPGMLIDIGRLPELQGISRTTEGSLKIGALTTHAQLGADPLVRSHAPLLAQAVPLIAHPAIRNRGTIGGSLAYADPAAELPACCVALEATIVVTSARGERRISAPAFFTGLFETALAQDELIVAVEVPPSPPNARTTILEIARRSGDYAMAGLAARLSEGAIRLVFFGVGAIPVEAREAARTLGTGPWSTGAVEAAQAALARDLDPPADQHGGPDFKRHLARVLLARALERLAPSRKASAP